MAVLRPIFLVNITNKSGVNKFVAEMESKGGVEKIENL